MIRQTSWWTRLAAVDEERLLAWILSGGFVSSAVLRSLYLFSDIAVQPGIPKVVYGAAMAMSLLAGVVLAVRPRLDRRAALAWVLFADLIYAVLAVTVSDPDRFASPVLMLFATVVAAWFLRLPAIGAHLVVVFVVHWLVLAPSVMEPYLHVVQVLLQAGMLVGTAAAVYLLRRRSDRVLAAMHEMSTTDQLTGLPNRRHLESQMATFWARARREGDVLAALVLDLDRFKQINDEHGHAVGDAVLKAVATAVRRVLRGQDVVARTGGEEIVVLSQVPGPEEALALADRVRREVTTVPAPVRTTASVGVATVRPAEVADPVNATWRLIDVADGAMYRAKRQGRDQSVLVEADIA